MFVNVKTAEGRKAFTKAVGGLEIPSDKFVPVRSTPWIDGLVRTGDVILQPQEQAAPPLVAAVAKAATRPSKATPAADSENK